MKRTILVLILTIAILTACGTAPAPAAVAVENFLQALSDKNDAVMLSYVCPDYEFDALLEFDSFALVQTTLTDLSCQQTGTDGNDALVVCSGSIDATYGSELRSFDLSERRYRVINDGGNWLVCGYTK